MSLRKFGWLLFWVGASLFVAAIGFAPFLAIWGLFADSPQMQSGASETADVLMILIRTMPVITVLGIAIVFISDGLNWWRRKQNRPL
jgi:hypothetical protein